MVRRILPLVLLISLLPVGSSASAGAQFQSQGCYRDPVGDAADPHADINEVCVFYERDRDFVVVLIDTVASQAPTTDDAWLNQETRAVVGISTDADPDFELSLSIFREGDMLESDLIDLADDSEVCDPETLVLSGTLAARFPPSCLAGASPIQTMTTMMYQPTAGTAVAVDQTPDDALTAPLPDDPPEAPVCANATVETGTSLSIFRLACGIGGSEPISQAVATAQYVFDDPDTPVIDPYQADWVVIARDDDFADALAGSSLSFGQGPLLFTYSPVSAPAGADPTRLATTTRAELLRSLRRGGTVYLLGGTAALHPGIDQELTELGYEVVRFAGESREGTAHLVSREVARILDEFVADTDFIDTNMVLIATRGNWPDAVVAGSVGAFWGMPVLLVNVDPPVHPETLAALDELRPDYIHVIGGSGVISSAAGGEIGQHARDNGYAMGRAGEDLTGPTWGSFCGSFVCRWGGSNRIQTGGAVGQLNRDMVNRFAPLTSFVPDNPQQYAAGVFLGADGPNFTYALAAATVSGRFGGAVFIPTENDTLSDDIINALCNTPGSERFVEQVENLVLVTDTDVLSDAYAQQVRQLVEGGCPPPP